MKSAAIIGCPGGGKTSTLIEIMRRVRERIPDPHSIGFVAFTRSARREAVEQAAEAFDVSATSLRRSGWFATLHSACYRVLGAKDGDLIMSDRAADREWLQEGLQEEFATEADDNGLGIQCGASRAARIIELWNVARNRLEPLSTVWQERKLAGSTPADLPGCQQVVERYEQLKRLDHRMDFVDLLLRVAGKRATVAGVADCEPDGELPMLPVWFHDEFQDASALLVSTFRRLIHGARYVYVVGDPAQSIYHWAGASPEFLLNWPADKRRLLVRSHRCPAEMLRLGEALLKGTSGWFERRLTGTQVDGDIETVALANWIEHIDSDARTLVLARTNRQLAKMEAQLSSAGVPWSPLKGRGGADAPKKKRAVLAMRALQTAGVIDGEDWAAVLDVIPSEWSGVRLLEHGTKARFKRPEEQEQYPFVTLRQLRELGATERLIDLLGGKDWSVLLDGKGKTLLRMLIEGGESAFRNPPVRTATIHASKGATADDVVMWAPLSRPTDDDDEERRVAYVGVTRARRRLRIVTKGSIFAELLDPNNSGYPVVAKATDAGKSVGEAVDEYVDI